MDNIEQMVDSVRKSGQLDLDEIGLIGLAEWWRINGFDGLASQLSDYIWSELGKYGVVVYIDRGSVVKTTLYGKLI